MIERDNKNTSLMRRKIYLCVCVENEKRERKGGENRKGRTRTGERRIFLDKLES